MGGAEGMKNYNAVIPWNHIVGTRSSETSSISQDNISQDGISYKCNVKMQRVFSDSLFWPSKKVCLY